jgi:hypothetical protein
VHVAAVVRCLVSEVRCQGTRRSEGDAGRGLKREESRMGRLSVTE